MKPSLTCRMDVLEDLGVRKALLFLTREGKEGAMADISLERATGLRTVTYPVKADRRRRIARIHCCKKLRILMYIHEARICDGTSDLLQPDDRATTYEYRSCVDAPAYVRKAEMPRSDKG